MDTPGNTKPSILVPAMRVEEVHLEQCACDVPLRLARGETVGTDCRWCRGSGYMETKRIVRRIPEPTFDERAALAQIKTLTDLVLKGAATIEHAAQLLLQAGKTQQAAETRAAAQAMRQSVEQG